MAFFQWTAEADETVRSLAAKGRSASQIAAVLGTTRNSVIGRAGRRGLQLNSTQSATSRKAAKAGRKVAEPVRITTVTLPAKVELPVAKPVVVAPVEVAPFGITFMDLGPRSCRYALGGKKSRPEVFCGLETEPGCAWCARHRAVVYQPRPTKKTSPQTFRFAASKAVAR